MDSLTIAVGGMTCGGCVVSVERALERVPGVTRVRADLAKKQAVVEGQKLDFARLAAALDDAGYEAAPG